MMTNIMLDLETMSTDVNAAIMSIGAVKFNNNKVIDRFYETTSLSDCVNKGLSMSAHTVMWWLEQSLSARQEFFTNTVPLEAALASFSKWVDPGDIVWGDGSDFDNLILANAYSKCGYKIPWEFRNNRCYRTLKNMYPEIKIGVKEPAHHALLDATEQAKHLMAILKELG